MRPTEFRTLLAAAERVAALEGLLQRARVSLGYHEDNCTMDCDASEVCADIEAALRAENGGGEK